MAVLNLIGVLERLVADLAERLPEFAHLDPSRILVCTASSREGSRGGTYARIHPLRFPGGERETTLRRGRRHYHCAIPTVLHRGEEMAYLVCFLVPRFLDLPLREKLLTICHELYHISPAFDGDLRRFAGRAWAHGSSLRRYNRLMGELADRYLALPGAAELAAPLEGDTASLRQRYQSIIGRRYSIPRLQLTPLAASEAPRTP